MDGQQGETGPIDFDVLLDMRSYLAGTERFESVTHTPSYAPDSLVCHYDIGYYPASVEEAFLEITWYVTDDFTIHYQETDTSGTERTCRWDRHPNEHNARDHYHPLPDAERPGVDADFPDDWKDVLANVLDAIDDRIASFWE